MSNITVNPANGPITVTVTVTSLQVVGIGISVIMPDGNTETESYITDSKANNPYNKVLTLAPGSCSGYYVVGSYTIIDPIGAGNPYTIVMSLQQLGVALLPNITLTGTSAAGKVNRTGTFKIN
ncbi:MAG TPA: hypothetical protein VK705_02235 [Ferruginibacter sp.]|jgi:hypothetical protein|nr:hypothetical protein [Ferruginibacter sp.]